MSPADLHSTLIGLNAQESIQPGTCPARNFSHRAATYLPVPRSLLVVRWLGARAFSTPLHQTTTQLPACPVAAAAEIIRAHITYPDIIHPSILVLVRGCFPCRPFAFTDDLVHELPGLGILLVSCMRPGTCISAAPLLVSLLHAPKVTPRLSTNKQPCVVGFLTLFFFKKNLLTLF